MSSAFKWWLIHGVSIDSVAVILASVDHSFREGMPALWYIPSSFRDGFLKPPEVNFAGIVCF